LTYEDIVVEALERAKRRFAEIRVSGEAAKVVGRGASGDKTLLLDKALEDEILTILNERLEGCLIVSEEAGLLGDPSSELTALVDPVDGSTNAGRGIPLFSASLAIARGRRFSDIVAAGTVDLVNGEIIVASKGKGCRVDGREAHPSKIDDLDAAVISLSLRVRGCWKNAPNLLANLINNIRHPRILGTAALETAYVAVGRVDGFIEPYPRLRTFDCLPSLFLVKEAKGVFKMLNAAEDIDLRSDAAIGYAAAGCQTLLDKILRLIG
jgi:myo-inositol-1(or 4)-monophosphatase